MNFLRSFKFYANLGLTCFVLTVTQAYGSSTESAGEVTFALGKAYLNGKNLIKTGQAINEGDVIETLSNGHVHIRFVDNGLISVRPDSRLSIEHYNYDTEHPDESIIKFNLNEGVMRSISGSGAKAARDKFRLNTPIAAIGVRGTDFVVKASDDLVQAIVNEGAIVVAPLSIGCSTATFGPCQTNSVELTSQAKQLLELSVFSDTARLIPLSASFTAPLQNVEVQPLTSTPKNKKPKETPSDSEQKTEISLDNQDTEANVKNIEMQNSDAAQSDITNSTSSDDENVKVMSFTSFEADSLHSDGVSTETINNTSTPTNSFYDKANDSVFDKLIESGISEADAQALIGENQANAALNEQSDEEPAYDIDEQKFIWGRLNASAQDYDTLILGHDPLALHPKEVNGIAIPTPDSVLSRSTHTILFSNPDNQPLDTELGAVSFNLSASQVNLLRNEGGPEALRVRESSLNVDFTHGTFDTKLIMDGNLKSEITYRAAGMVDSRGEFFVNGDNSKFKGMTSVDGEASTYMFYKDIDEGIIEGATLWDR